MPCVAVPYRRHSPASAARARTCAQVVSALSEPGRRHVPFRATALTRALRGALGGGCRTTLVACVWDSPAHAAETLATCRWGPVASRSLLLQPDTWELVYNTHSLSARLRQQKIQRGTRHVS
jgi:hypothetical protein